MKLVLMKRTKSKYFITTIPENFQILSRFPDEFTFVTFFTEIGFDSPAKLYAFVMDCIILNFRLNLKILKS